MYTQKGKLERKTACRRHEFPHVLEDDVVKLSPKERLTRTQSLGASQGSKLRKGKLLDKALGKDFLQMITNVVEISINQERELLRNVEIRKAQNQRLGLFMKFGNGIDRDDGIFISRVALGSLADKNDLLHTGDEIVKINGVEVVNRTLEDVVTTMQKAEILIIETRSALPFDTHAVNVRSKPKDLLPATDQHDAASRTTSSSVFHPTKLFPVDGVTKKRSRTGYDDDLYLKNDAYDTRNRARSTNVCRLQQPGVQKINENLEIKTYDASSSSDSEDLNQSAESQISTYPSNTPPTNLSINKSFTGKLAVNISTISGLPAAEASGNTNMCYCTVEINKEFKAKTKSHKVDSVVAFDDDFDIDVQGANALIIKLYQENRLLADKCMATSCIILETLFEDENHKKFILCSTNTKDDIHTRLNVRFSEAQRHFQRRQSTRTTGVFGFNLSKTLVTEKNTIPILVRKCVAEIEQRGLDLEGIYRISGNARKKKALREEFEQNSHDTDISESDSHVITGILKDYLRKLPNPLISDKMYKIIRDKQKEVGSDRNAQKSMLSHMIKMAPYVNRATLIFIMDHFQRVIEHIENNKMSSKNIAVCFGPVLLSPPIEEMKDFQKYIDALEFLISIWPTQEDANQNMI